MDLVVVLTSLTLTKDYAIHPVAYHRWVHEGLPFNSILSPRIACCSYCAPLVHITYKQSGHARNAIHTGTTGIVISAKRATTTCIGRRVSTMDTVDRAVHAAAVNKQKSSADANRVLTF